MGGEVTAERLSDGNHRREQAGQDRKSGGEADGRQGKDEGERFGKPEEPTLESTTRRF